MRKLSIDGKRRNVRVHREVCIETYGPPPRGKPEAMHLCGVRTCVEPTHLQWGNRWENEQHKKIHGTVAKGERNGRAKLSLTQIASIKNSKGKVPRKELATKFGVSPQQISKIWLGRRWSS
jgi:hypothetical protein